MCHVSFRGVQSQLRTRAINCQYGDPYPDGRSRIYVWPQGTPRFLAKTTDDADEAYVMGLRMAGARDKAKDLISRNLQFAALTRSRNHAFA